MTPEALADYLLGDPVPFDPAALARLEARAGEALPADYRDFLMLHRNGGMTSPTAIEQPGLVTRSGHEIEQFYAVTGLAADWNRPGLHNYPVTTLRDWLAVGAPEPDQVPLYWIVIGGNWSGDQFALDLSVPGGEVVWFDHELLFPEEDDPFPHEEGIVRLGESFAAFVEGLTAPPPFEAPPPPVARGWWQRFFGG
jgi:SMI1 / KNR4 family (SUKH-1)